MALENLRKTLNDSYIGRSINGSFPGILFEGASRRISDGFNLKTKRLEEIAVGNVDNNYSDASRLYRKVNQNGTEMIERVTLIEALDKRISEYDPVRKYIANELVHGWKSRLVDAVALGVSFTPVRALNEMYLSGGVEWLVDSAFGFELPDHFGLSLTQCTRSRTNSLPIFIFGKEIMKLKDLWKRKVWKITPESSIKRIRRADQSFSAMMQLGVYSGILLASGVHDPKKMAITLGTNLVIQTYINSRAVIPFVERVQDYFGTTPAYRRKREPSLETIKDILSQKISRGISLTYQTTRNLTTNSYQSTRNFASRVYSNSLGSLTQLERGFVVGTTLMIAGLGVSTLGYEASYAEKTKPGQEVQNYSHIDSMENKYDRIALGGDLLAIAGMATMASSVAVRKKTID